jgi:hypothetical protein
MSESEDKKPKFTIQRAMWTMAGAILGYFVLWTFTTVSAHTSDITGIRTEQKGKSTEDQAQWMSIRQHSTRMTEAEIELEVTKRLFALLLKEGELTVKVDAVVGELPPKREEKKPPKPPIEPPKQDDLSSFIQQQKTTYEQKVLKK